MMQQMMMVRMMVEALACTSEPRLGSEAQPKATRKVSGGVGNGGRPSHFNVGLGRALGMALEDPLSILPLLSFLSPFSFLKSSMLLIPFVRL
jgi:hypothetical protein